MDPYESPRVDPYAQSDLATADLLPPPATEERLGMLHGLLYVAALGVVGCVNVAVRDAVLYGVFSPGWWTAGIIVVLDAAGLAAIALAVWRRIQRAKTFPAHFGHWLLLALGGDFLMYALNQPFHYWIVAGVEPGLEGEWPADVDAKLRTVYGLLITLGAITPGLAMFYSRGQIFWQRYAPLLIANTIWLGARHFMNWENRPFAIGVSNTISFLGLVCFLIAAGRDVRQPEGKDQVHWVGIGVHCALIFYYRFMEYYWGTGTEWS